MLSAVAAGRTRLLSLSTRKAGADSPGPAKLRAVAEPGSHLQRPSDSGSRHGSARLGTARHGTARPAPLLPIGAAAAPPPPGAPAGVAVGSAAGPSCRGAGTAPHLSQVVRGISSSCHPTTAWFGLFFWFLFRFSGGRRKMLKAGPWGYLCRCSVLSGLRGARCHSRH